MHLCREANVAFGWSFNSLIEVKPKKKNCQNYQIWTFRNPLHFCSRNPNVKCLPYKHSLVLQKWINSDRKLVKQTDLLCQYGFDQARFLPQLCCFYYYECQLKCCSCICHYTDCTSVKQVENLKPSSVWFLDLSSELI